MVGNKGEGDPRWTHGADQGKEDVDVKSIIPHGLGDGIWPIMEWEKLLMGSYKEFFLQLQPNFVAHLKLMWHPVLIMSLLVCGIGLL